MVEMLRFDVIALDIAGEMVMFRAPWMILSDLHENVIMYILT